MGDNDYHVVPESLRKMAQRLGQIAKLYEDATGWVQGISMRPYDLGLLGAMAKLPDTYNQGTLKFQAEFRQAGERTRDAESALKKVAEVYEDKDAEWWRRFGYTDS
ncbi:MAG: hypothetical protein GEV03_25380 [Streptosporangiales bacterium]|nr:hypothetical protein [Streptosporangiales bacterium]